MLHYRNGRSKEGKEISFPKEPSLPRERTLAMIYPSTGEERTLIAVRLLRLIAFMLQPIDLKPKILGLCVAVSRWKEKTGPLNLSVISSLGLYFYKKKKTEPTLH